MHQGSRLMRPTETQNDSPIHSDMLNLLLGEFLTCRMTNSVTGF